MADCVSVQVALRVRPLVDAEIQRGCQLCLECVPNEPQVIVRGADKAFTFNYVFGPDDDNECFYETAVKELVSHVFKGYNVTILAYGQTGSGKTYSMGTTYNEGENYGVIPRAVNDVFKNVADVNDREFKMTVSFMELYQEQVFDLLDPSRSTVDIREVARDVIVPGLTEVVVHSTEETIQCLIQGSLGRATGATAMNAQSSRSHAIFTITVHQQSKTGESNFMTSKFHLVDLAGSERSKKTKASGVRFKEGIHINRGLFALGNVISALGEECQKGYISYRDSKLTRLLQDSLGGNSLTLMVACVSPADYNLDETLSTLRYADRARRIKNKPIVNQDRTVAYIAKLRQEICDAQAVIQNSKTITQCPHLEHQVKNNCLAKEHIILADVFNSICYWNCILEECIQYSDNSRSCLEIEKKKICSTYDEVVETMTQIIDSNILSTSLREPLKYLQGVLVQIKELQGEQNWSTEEIFNKEYLVEDINLQNCLVAKACSLDHINLINFDDDQFIQRIEQRIELIKQLVMHKRVVAHKQKLIDELELNSNQTDDLNIDHKCIVKNLVSQVQVLQKKKEELQHSLQEIKNSAATPKREHQLIAYKERMAALQEQIPSLITKISEQCDIIRRKEREEQRIKILNNEIMLMKKKNIILVTQMKNVNNQFKNMKSQSEREINRLVHQNRKAQKEVRDKEKRHAKEQNVWKQKLQKAVAVNKRLKDALDVAKFAQEKHRNNESVGRVHIWLPQELEIMCNIKDAKKALQDLGEETCVITEQVTALSNHLEYETISGDEKYTMEEELKQLTEIISARKAQMAELQNKISDSDQETKNKTQWDCIQTLSEAKCVLKYLLNTVMDTRREKLQIEKIHRNLMSEIELKETIIHENNIILAKETEEYQQKIIGLEREYLEKILIRLQLFSGVITNEVVKQVSDRLKRCQQLEAILKRKDTEYQWPLNQYCETMVVAGNSSEGELDVDGETKPFWQRTPVFKRIQRLKTRKSEIQEEKEITAKRTLDGNSKCFCKSRTSVLKCRGCYKVEKLSPHPYKKNLSHSANNKLHVNENYQSNCVNVNEVKPENIKKSQNLKLTSSCSQHVGILDEILVQSECISNEDDEQNIDKSAIQ